MQMQAKKVKGFSLLELLVVVVVIGIISSVVTHLSQNGKVTERQETV